MHVKHLADLLANQGHEVTVLYSADAAKWKGVYQPSAEFRGKERLEEIASRSWRWHVLCTYITNRSSRVRNRLEQVVTRVRPDVVHYHNVSLLGWYGFRRRVKTLYTAHDHWPICQRNDLLKYGDYVCDRPECIRCCLISRRPPQLGRRWDGSIGPAFDPEKILAPSRYMASKLGQRLTGYRGEIVHCPNFVPDHDFERGPRDDSLLYVGGLSPHKGIRSLVEAAVSNTLVSLDVVGDGPEMATLRAIVDRSEAGDRVRFRGWCPPESLSNFYQRAKALVVPSVCPENAPLVVLEALASGTPVIGTRLGGMPEILDPIDSRLCKDSNQLLEGLDAVDWVASLGSACRQEWERLYSPSAFLRRYVDVLKEN